MLNVDRERECVCVLCEGRERKEEEEKLNGKMAVLFGPMSYSIAPLAPYTMANQLNVDPSLLAFIEDGLKTNTSEEQV